MAWAKERALEYLPADPLLAMNSFVSDLGKHEETTGHPVIELMTMEAVAGLLDGPECRRMIEGTR